MRLVTALAKYLTAAWAITATSRAIEILGGNGYTEEYPTARLYRDAQVLTVWEGPPNIQALEVLRLAGAESPGLAAYPRAPRRHPRHAVRCQPLGLRAGRAR